VKPEGENDAATPSFLEVSLRLERRHVPLAEDLMLAQGAQAVTLMDHGDTPLWEPPVGETPLWEVVRLTGLFDPKIDRSRLFAALALLPVVAEPETNELEDQPWERAWMDRFVPMRFGDALWIIPTGAEPPDPEATLLHLDPGVAFGTGTHETTHLCLEWLDRADLAGRSVLDFGCGSGVLGIAAALLGAGAVTCIDYDPQAIWATRQNADRNAVSRQVAAEEGDRPPEGQWNLVLANILAGILERLVSELVASVKPGGTLVLTGILREQAYRVRATFSNAGLPLEQSAARGDWVLLSGSRPGEAS
jgi:ribosomal protein L11 methyltransferase